MDEETREEGGESQQPEITEQQESEGQNEGHSDYKPVNRFDAAAVHHLSGMYQNWFLDYASYVILERAVPHIEDGLKPVQRRILHSMKRMDDGRYNKVANIVGHTMQFHPHGDASIGEQNMNNRNIRGVAPQPVTIEHKCVCLSHLRTGNNML